MTQHLDDLEFKLRDAVHKRNWDECKRLEAEIARLRPGARRQKILNTVNDLVGRFTYYNRKEDDELPVGAIEEAIRAGETTVDEIVGEFSRVLRASVMP